MAIAETLAGTIGSGVLNAISSQLTQQQNRRDMDYMQSRYLSPQAQVNNLAAAGINPAVAMGNQSPVFSSGGSLGSNAPVLGTQSINDLANGFLAVSQAKKVGLEEEAQGLANKLMKDTYKDQVEKIGLENHWTKEQIAKTSQEIGLMSGQFNEIQQRIENMRSEKALTDKSISWFDRHMKAEINHLRSSADYQDALKGLTDSQKELLDNTMNDLCDITHYQAEQMSKIVDLLGRYGEAQAIVGMLSQVVGSASDLIGSITSLKNANKVVETITGSTTQKSNGDWSTTNTRTTRK